MCQDKEWNWYNVEAIQKNKNHSTTKTIKSNRLCRIIKNIINRNLIHINLKDDRIHYKINSKSQSKSWLTIIIRFSKMQIDTKTLTQIKQLHDVIPTKQQTNIYDKMTDEWNEFNKFIQKCYIWYQKSRISFVLHTKYIIMNKYSKNQLVTAKYCVLKLLRN